jgi:hypothetical protein
MSPFSPNPENHVCPIHRRSLAMSGSATKAKSGCPTLAKLGWGLLTLTSITATTFSQQSAAPAPQSPFAGLIAEYLRRDANGHSPNSDEISAMGALQPTPDAASIREAMPYLLKALDNPDIPLHTFALTALIGLQSPGVPAAPGAPSQAVSSPEVGSTQPPTDPQPGAPSQAVAPPEMGSNPPPGPAIYKPDVAKALTPYIPQIATHLTSEESPSNRLLTATILGAFTPDPPSAVYAPLLAYLKRDDAISPVGEAVVSDLLQLGPISADTAAAISRYIRRGDQTSDSRANLADLIASHANQSQSLNQALLLYLGSDDNALRARVILSLPQLDLAPDVFADTKARVEQVAANPNENLQVVTAAKSVVICWTSTKMASGCPVYEISK